MFLEYSISIVAFFISYKGAEYIYLYALSLDKEDNKKNIYVIIKSYITFVIMIIIILSLFRFGGFILYNISLLKFKIIYLDFLENILSLEIYQIMISFGVGGLILGFEILVKKGVEKLKR